MVQYPGKSNAPKIESNHSGEPNGWEIGALDQIAAQARDGFGQRFSPGAARI
jgi:hypothetical protein